MTLFPPDIFFDLSTYKHGSLFSQKTHVWEALLYIKEYCLSFSYPLFSFDAPGAFFVNKGSIFLGEGTIVEPGAYIEGPCIIGERCTIRHGAYIRGNVIIGDDCVIGHDTEVKHSILLDGAKAAHFSYIGDSILGNNVNLGAGTKCANVKLDREAISIHDNGKSIETKLKKLGAIIGDGVQLGCNCVTNPGTLIGRRSRCYPCLNIGGVIPANALIQPAAKAVIKEIS